MNSTAQAHKEIKRGSVISSISTIIGICGTLLVTPFILKQIGDNDYGLYQMVGPLVTSIGMLSFGLNNSLVRFLAKYRSTNDKESEERILGMMHIVFAIIAAVAVSVGIACYFLLPRFYTKLHGPDLLKAKLIFAIMVINMGISIISQIYPSIMTAYEKFTVLNTWGLIKNIFVPIFKVILVYLGVGVFSIVISEVFFNLAYQTTIMLNCRVKLKVKFSYKHFDKGLLKELFIYSSFIFASSVADLLYWQIDKVLVGKFIGSAEVTPLTFGNHFADYFIKIATMISGMFMMRVMTMVVNNASGEQLTGAMIKLGRIQALILGLLYCGYIVVGRQFLDYYYSSGTTHTRDIAFLIGFMLLTALLIPEVEILGISILQAKNMHRFRAVMYLGIAVCNALLTIPFTKYFGVIGATIATVLALILGQIIIMNWYYKNRVGINIWRFFKETCHGILPIALVTIAFGFLTFFIQSHSIFNLVLRALIILIIYCVLQWFLGMNDFEHGLFAELYGKVKKLVLKPFARLKSKTSSKRW
ncbi:MAG: oligosaccharide flippase family protein [Clostridia bacterium]|nr:oligosaccharide flippase family protein [Clostridia bacterium]